jgi:hypothetical protein
MAQDKLHSAIAEHAYAIEQENRRARLAHAAAPYHVPLGPPCGRKKNRLG